jgi:regulator of nucleoside diphosphate kinase
MRERQITVTASDRMRLGSLIDRISEVAVTDRRYLDDLEFELERAQIVDAAEVPGDVITMNSTVRLRDLDNGDELDLTLVYPQDAKIDENRISILAPIGTAMIGYRAGDEIEWPVPDGKARFKVEDIVYQPESAGVFDR